MGASLMDVYNPDNAPSPNGWLALSEFDRIDLAEDFHRDSGDFGGSLRAHAAIHVAVENQVALGEPEEVAAAISRLMGAGLSRHDAVHAVGSVLTEHLFPVLKAAVPFDEKSYQRSLSSLTPESWRGGG